MLEQQRIDYLQAMGIQLWMPRYALENAAESSWLADSSDKETALEPSGHALVKAGHAADLLAGMALSDTAKPDLAQSKDTSNPKQAVDPQQGITAAVDSQTAPLDASVDLTVPTFELHFALWPCGILWVSSNPLESQDQGFQMSVSYALLGNAAPQASYSQFKWPYIEGSHEDQSMPVALRALTAQWEFMSGQGARGWVAMDSASQQWLEKVASKALFSVSERKDLYSAYGKKQLWLALKTLPQK